jgi:hypothetical protein
VQRVRHVGRDEEGAARGRVDVRAAVDAREGLDERNNKVMTKLLLFIHRFKKN